MKNGLFVDPIGRQMYYKDDLLHRKSDPAVIYPNGTQEWWLNGKLHREAGPAVIWADGRQFWYLNGVAYSFKEYVNQLFPEDSPERTAFLLKWSGS